MFWWQLASFSREATVSLDPKRLIIPQPFCSAGETPALPWDDPQADSYCPDSKLQPGLGSTSKGVGGNPARI